jgi:demethylmenaquinone methyltransferase/2-methoxy-6-polyprenyl-1,4-benzoquinol methylase
MDTRTLYDRLSSVYDLLADSSEAACRAEGLALLHARAGERVLEVGFGTGHALAALGRAVGPAGLVVGVDVSSGMLAAARRSLASAGAGRVVVALNDARNLCFRDHVFDAAFLSFTLELFDRPDMLIVLSELARVLRPGGRLGVVAMAETDPTNAMIDFYQWLHRHFPHFVDCRPIRLEERLAEAGFVESSQHRLSIWRLSVLAVVAVNEARGAAR